VSERLTPVEVTAPITLRRWVSCPDPNIDFTAKLSDDPAVYQDAAHPSHGVLPIILR
jgi:hypothetical protein